MKPIGIGISTYNRPDVFEVCLKSVLEYAPLDSKIFVSDDGSTEDYGDLFALAESRGITVFRAEHSNIATSKNRLLAAMMDTEVRDLFLIEDDMEITSPSTFRKYVRASSHSGVQHLMFAHHGKRNEQVDVDDLLTYHYECVGSFCYYTRNAIEMVGFMDEVFQNCWEHVVHSMLIDDAGLMPKAGWRRWPDVNGSEKLIKEIKSSSTHAELPEEELMAQSRIQDGLKYWRDNYRFPEDILPLIKS